MPVTRPQTLTASCLCGQVAFEMRGAPILTVACYCASCQEAGQRMARLADAPAMLTAEGGTDFVLVRKDRIARLRGGERLREHRLKPNSPTRRMVASCCDSAMFLEFSKGHWLSVYRDRVADAPALEMRVMTADRREGVELTGDVPTYATHSGRFMWKLLLAWAAMGFRAPKVTGAPA